MLFPGLFRQEKNAKFHMGGPKPSRGSQIDFALFGCLSAVVFMELLSKVGA